MGLVSQLLVTFVGPTYVVKICSPLWEGISIGPYRLSFVKPHCFYGNPMKHAELEFLKENIDSVMLCKTKA